jgi:hypothetical protein
MGSIKNGDLVWNGYSGLLRVGTVKSQRIDKSGWAYYRIDWHNDEKYQKAQDSCYAFNENGNYGLEEFKAGQINKVSPEALLEFVKSHKNHNIVDF